MTIYQTKLRALEDRTVNFSVAVVRQCGPYDKDIRFKSIVDQTIRAATSIGANYAEANNASSKADFKNKIFIAKKEAAETKYWLTVLSELIPAEDFSALMQEALEFTLIFQKIIATLKSRNEK